MRVMVEIYVFEQYGQHILRVHTAAQIVALHTPRINHNPTNYYVLQLARVRTFDLGHSPIEEGGGAKHSPLGHHGKHDNKSFFLFI